MHMRRMAILCVSIIIIVAVWHSLRSVLKKKVQVATVVHFSYYSKKGVFMSLLKSMDARTYTCRSYTFVVSLYSKILCVTFFIPILFYILKFSTLEHSSVERQIYIYTECREECMFLSSTKWKYNANICTYTTQKKVHEKIVYCL